MCLTSDNNMLKRCSHHQYWSPRRQFFLEEVLGLKQSVGNARGKITKSNKSDFWNHLPYIFKVKSTMQTHPCNENRFFPVRISSQGKPCFHYREPCSHRFFPVRISSQGKSCFHYRDGFAVQSFHSQIKNLVIKSSKFNLETLK